MSAVVQFLSNPVVGGIASLITIISFFWGVIQSLRAKRLHQELEALRVQLNLEGGVNQRNVSNHDRATYFENASDVNINHGSD